MQDIFIQNRSPEQTTRRSTRPAASAIETQLVLLWLCCCGKCETITHSF